MGKPITLKEIEALCQEDGDCLIWKGSFSRSGAPVRRYRSKDGRGITQQIRRRMLELKTGRPIPDGQVATNCCGNPACLAHLETTTRGEVIRRQWQLADVRARLIAAGTKASRARAKLDLETAREIRESEETLEEVSARIGISPTTASLVRRNMAWRERESNPFAGLGA
jgi:hypothetical protein